MNAPTVTLTVPAEVWGALTAAAIEHGHLANERTKDDLGAAAMAFVRAGLMPEASRPILPPEPEMVGP